MYLEFVILNLLLIAGLLYFSKLDNLRLLGVFAGAIMLLQGFWLLDENIFWKTSEIITLPNYNSTVDGNTTTTIYLSNQTYVNVYQEIPAYPWMRLESVLSLMFIFGGIYLFVENAWRLTTKL